ncbi:MAG: response regulator transcription factor [Proteobacteria bacterium]|nr:response regulator transcription factor [Pseudomonadota bacterium]
MSDQHILVIEDEIKIAKLLCDYLKDSGFQATSIGNGNEALSVVKKNEFDLLLLDISLPGMDGIELCKEVRRFSDVPIIMVTAKADTVDRLIGLELGADDYICKPFDPREVVSRVKAVFRRTNRSTPDSTIVEGDIELNEQYHQVLIKETEVKLTPIEFDLLKLFLSNPNRVFSRNELLNQIQGYDFEGYDRTVDNHIKNLRKKIMKFYPDKEVIQTVYGVGYKLVPVR